MEKVKDMSIYQKVMIGFIITVLCLTFFSKSFYNYRLPVVTVVSPKSGELHFSAEGTGEVMYADVCSCYAEKDGIILDIFVEEGDEIKKGQQIMQIKASDTNKTDNITAMEDGILTSIGVKKGMYVSYMTNTVLYEEAKVSDEWNVSVQFSDNELEYVEEGSKAIVKLPYENVSLNGEVIGVSPYANASFTGYLANVQFSSENTSIAGKRADVTIKRDSLMFDTLIPVAALRKDSKGYYVLVLYENGSILGDGYITQRLSVDLIDSDESYCAVEGLPEDENIIVAATKEIAEGDSVYYEGGEEESE